MKIDLLYQGWKVLALEIHLGSSPQLSSSIGLGWRDIVIGRYLADPGERSEAPTSHHIIGLASGQQRAYGLRAGRLGRLIPYSKEPGEMFIHTEGLIRAVYPSSQTEVIMCALNSTFVAEVAAEHELHLKPELREQVSLRDQALDSLLRLLESEARFGGLSGRLYVDHLTYTLAIRPLTPETEKNDKYPFKDKLPHPRLQRVVERMEADLSADLDLKTLAADSGYSRNHFLRKFRAATGYTPHQYLLQLRIRKAQEMMNDKSVRLIDVALACGFSSDAHFSRVFRQIVGATPSEYRRNI
jgi:AraC family transcriptional regulator